jgi:hypothetical protein
MSKILRKSLKLITVNGTVKTNVLEFRDNNFSCDIQRFVRNDKAHDKLSDKKTDKKCKHLSNFPAVTQRTLYLLGLIRMS